MRWLFDLLGLSPTRMFVITLTQPTRPFFVPVDCEWYGQAIQDLLEGHGIEMLAWDVLCGEQCFLVRSAQKDWACQVLVSAGVPLLHERWSSE